jgi:hypothetical protein
MKALDIAAGPINPAAPEKEPSIYILPGNFNIALGSGMSATAPFTLYRHNTKTAVTLSAGPVPQGISVSITPQALPSTTGSQNFSVTVTAAVDVTPVDVTIPITASSPIVDDVQVSVRVNARAVGQGLITYQILALLYAPPGTNGGSGRSQVVYSSESTFGTKDSISSTFKDGVNVTVTPADLEVGPVTLGSSVDFTADQSSTDSSSYEIKKSTSSAVTVTGPSRDGIDHGADFFYIWLNPLLNITYDHIGNVYWEPRVDGPYMDLQLVYVDWLKDPSLMPSDLAKRFAARGMTQADYDQILQTNPFTSGKNPPIDPVRFVPIGHSFPYEPPRTPADPVPTMTFKATTDSTTTDGEESDVHYEVGLSLSAGIKDALKAVLKASGSLDWTEKSETTIETSQSAEVTVGGPAYGYNGPTDVVVYWDRNYNVFMFAFAPEPPVIVGTLLNTDGTPIPHKGLEFTIDGRTLTTFTNQHGEYRLYDLARHSQPSPAL